MLRSIASLAVMAAAASAETCTLSSGNYYCSAVDQVQFSSVGYTGTYNKITAMDSDTGSCSSSSYSFSGSMAPFDEGLSVHFRGPIKLLQFGVYTQSSSSSRKREVEPESKNGLHHNHKRALVTKYEEITAYVTVDAEGNTLTETSTSTSVGEAAGSTTTSESEALLASVANYNYNHEAESSASGPSVITVSSSSSSTGTATKSSSTASSASSASSSSTATGSWTLSANYNAESSTAEGLVFLNNLGGSGSGVFDYTFGNSLSYMAADGVSCASSSEVLKETTVPSNNEFIIFSDTECTTANCGYSRDGTVAYEGFDGSEKIFVFEFTMPTESSVSSSTYNYDMPAIWLLNAQIPRTLQYGSASCSCWKTGCGEFDLFEVLTAGESRMLSTIHSGESAGCSDYFTRPTSSSMKAAVIFSGSTVTITTLDSDTSFPSSLDSDTVASWISATKDSSSSVTV